MKALKIAGVVVLGLWMAWVTLQLHYIKSIALEACGIAAVGGVNSNGVLKIPVVCPDLANNEVKRESSH
ncbi:MAG: hypothetical protein JSR55_11340 [Proteobacteria bacterium]|nr:hypothetical protein [Pseudomonadota bacterium]